MFPLTIEEANWIVKSSDSPPQYSGSIYIDDFTEDNEDTEDNSEDGENDEVDAKDEVNKDQDSINSQKMEVSEFLAKMLIQPPEKNKRASISEVAELFHNTGENTNK